MRQGAYETLFTYGLELPLPGRPLMEGTMSSIAGRSAKTFYAREAILEHLDELEDLCLAEQRLLDNRAGRSRTYTLEEVERELGLAD